MHRIRFELHFNKSIDNVLLLLVLHDNVTGDLFEDESCLITESVGLCLEQSVHILFTLDVNVSTSDDKIA